MRIECRKTFWLKWTESFFVFELFCEIFYPNILIENLRIVQRICYKLNQTFQSRRYEVQKSCHGRKFSYPWSSDSIYSAGHFHAFIVSDHSPDEWVVNVIHRRHLPWCLIALLPQRYIPRAVDMSLRTQHAPRSTVRH